MIIEFDFEFWGNIIQVTEVIAHDDSKELIFVKLSGEGEDDFEPTDYDGIVFEVSHLLNLDGKISWDRCD